MESNERQTVEAFSAVNERLAALSRQVTRTQAQAPTGKLEENPGFQALEKAVRNIVEHLEVADKRTRDNLKVLQERITDMGSRSPGQDPELVLRQAPAFAQLESRISELAERLDAHHQQAPVAELTDQLRSDVEHLAHRIESVRDSSEQLANRAQTQAVQAAQEELRAIETRIIGLLNEAKQSIVGNHVGPHEFNHFRHEIDALNARIDDATQQAASGHEVNALKDVVDELATRINQGGDSRPLADLDRKVIEIAQKLERTEAATRSLPQVQDLNRRMSELDQRLNDFMQNPAQSGGEEAFVSKLKDVDERLASTESQLSHLDTIERAISQLYDAIEQDRQRGHDVTHDVATRAAMQAVEQDRQRGEDAAHQAATRAAMQVIEQHQTKPTALTGSPEIMALEQGLHAVRQAAAAADHRNQETLEAVHETLEQIVSKLAELETMTVGQRIGQAIGALPMPDEEPAQDHSPASPYQEEPARPSPFPSHAYRQEPAQQSPFSSHAFSQPEPEAGPEHDAEMDSPISGFNNFMEPTFSEGHIRFEDDKPFEAEQAFEDPQGLEPAETEEATPASEDQGTAAPQDDPGIGDIIAAARRVQQINSGALSNVVPGKAKKARTRSSFSLPFLKRSTSKSTAADTVKPIASAAAASPSPKAANQNNKRRLIVMGVALLAIAGLVFFGTNTLGRIYQSKSPAVEQMSPQASAPAQGSDATPGLPTPDATPEVKTGQQGDASNALQPVDPILTGTLPQAQSPSDPSKIISDASNDAAAPSEVAMDMAVGPVKMRQAAQAGDSTAQFLIASHYLNGDTVSADPNKAAYWYSKASASGLAPAQYRLATLYERGMGVAKNAKLALFWYERAATQGNVKSMHNAAVLAASSDIGTPDYNKSFKWFSLAAAHGLKDSQYNLAVLLERGLGTKADVNEALFWYMAAAAQDDNEAKQRVSELSKGLSQASVDAISARFKQWAPDKAPDVANLVPNNDGKWNPPQSASGDDGDATLAAKSLLQKLGYHVGPQDGLHDGRVSNAVRLFQICYGMKATGKVTPELVSAMQSKVI